MVGHDPIFSGKTLPYEQIMLTYKPSQIKTRHNLNTIIKKPDFSSALEPTKHYL